MGGRGSYSSTAAKRAAWRRPAKPTQKGHGDGLQLGGFAEVGSAKKIAAFLGLSDEQRAYADYKAVAEYTGTHYSAIRRAAREGGADERWRQCEDYIAHAPQWEGGVTYRGIEWPRETFGQIKVGAQIDINGGGPASWSTSSSTSDSFAGNKAGSSVVFIAKRQKKATSIKGVSRHPGENEVLVSMSTKYRVTGVSNGHSASNNRIYVEVEVI